MRNTIIIFILILAGETIFLLPFVLPRIFRPTFLEVFGLTNFQLGSAFSVYGLVAMLAYVAGGPLADRFSSRKLMATAMMVTSAGGFILISLPGLRILGWLYAFWGLSTILLFWAAMLRATRIWGGDRYQGSAYGLLDAGRGLLAAFLASLSVLLFSHLLEGKSSEPTLLDREAALIYIIRVYSFFVVIMALLIWIFIPDSNNTINREKEQGIRRKNIWLAFRIPQVWLNAFIVLSAYVGYKCTDDFSLLAYDAYGYNALQSAQIGTISFWIRPVIALAAGLLADKTNGSLVVVISFAIALTGSLMIVSGTIIGVGYLWLIMTVAITSIGIYGVRGVYFALFNEAKIPLEITGSAIGVVSLIGFMPDIFMGPLTGYLIDQNPGILGHQYVFSVLALFSILGIGCALIFRRLRLKSTDVHV